MDSVVPSPVLSPPPQPAASAAQAISATKM
jgi:hypothetical protein